MSELDDRAERAAQHYRRLLLLLPRGLRRDFGEDMVEVFVGRWRATRPGADRVRLWVFAVADVVTQSVWERLTYANGHGEGRTTMGTMTQDIRYALRSLARSPLVTVLVVGTMALGVGASTVTFSVVNGVLLKPLPYAHPERLVAVWPEVNFNAAMVRELLASSPALESATGMSGWSFTLTGTGDPLDVSGARVSVDHFRVLGVEPILGRVFSSEEGVPGNDGVVILSHALWVRAFGGAPDVVGRTIDLATNDMPRRTVIGVMPPDFRPVSGDPEVWVPLAIEAGIGMAEDNTWYVNHRVARLAPGATLDQANEQLRAFSRTVVEQLPGSFNEERARTARVEPLQRHAAGDVAPILWVALGAVSLVLLIACANVANLLLARGETRARDLAVRAALGAERGRMLRLVLVESGLLGLAGGALGVALAFALLGLVLGLAPDGFPRIREVGVDAAVLLWALGATAGATLLAGLVPALRTTSVDPGSALSGGGRGASASKTSRLTPVLVAAEVALAVVVVVGSGLMLRSFQRLTDEDPGLRAEGTLVLLANPPAGRYADGAAFHAYYEQVLQRIEALPRVERASAIHLLPGTENNWSFPTFIEGVELPEGATTPSVNIRSVFPGYFETVGVGLIRGRTLARTDDAGSEAVVVVNQAFVDRFWPGLDPIGREVRHFSRTADPYRVVGVVGNVRQHGLGRQVNPEIYVAHAQLEWNMSFWVVARMRPGTSPEAYADQVREAVWSVDPDVPVSGLTELSRVYGDSAAITRFVTVVLSAFGGLALLLAAVGVFGVTAYTVGRRMAEFGVRVALGASRDRVLGAALAGTLLPVAVGLGAGLALALASAGALRSALYQVEPWDPATFAVVGGVLFAVACFAALWPAWRASGVDPVSVLKGD